MGKTLGALAMIGATIATSGAVAPFVSGAIVGIGGGTFAALGVSAILTPVLSLGIGAFVGSTLGGIITGNPSLGKPDTASVALKRPRPGNPLFEVVEDAA